MENSCLTHIRCQGGRLEKVLLLLIVLIAIVSKSYAQELSDPQEIYHSTLEIQGNIYGVADEHAHLVLGGIPDSLWIDTLSIKSTLVLFSDGAVYHKVDSAKSFNFFVDIGHEYLLVFIHPDYVIKSLTIDGTFIPTWGENLVMSINMSMFSPMVATDLKEPLSSAKYDMQSEKMEWDMEMFAKQLAKMLKEE